MLKCNAVCTYCTIIFHLIKANKYTIAQLRLVYQSKVKTIVILFLDQTYKLQTSKFVELYN
jgi:hypothetical protein